MALVSYDFGSGSEGSDSSDKEENISKLSTESKKIEFEVRTSAKNFTVTEQFSNLPKTRSVFEDIQEDKIEDFVPKLPPVKEKQKVKITIPSLSQFEEEGEEPKEKKFKPSVKGSGLMSLLPPVKNEIKTEKVFVPHIIAKKTMKNSTSRDYPVNNKNNQKSNVKLPPSKNKASSSDVETDDEDLEMPDTFDDAIWQKVCSRQKPKPVIQEVKSEVILEAPEETVNIAPEPEQPYGGLDNQAFKELVGKTKRPLGNIKLIDINEEQILPDKDLWLTKSLTDPELVPKDKIENPVDPTRRKKHHITYLAQQAKANEQELQSSWAASKNNRLLSRAKYGF